MKLAPILCTAVALVLAAAPAAAQDAAMPQDSAGYPVGEVSEQPRLANRNQIAAAMVRMYPPELRDQGITGNVAVKFRVLENGEVDTRTISIANPGAEPLFADVAITLAKQMRFRPARLDHRPVRVWVTVPISFQLNPLVASPDRSCGASAGCQPPSP